MHRLIAGIMLAFALPVCAQVPALRIHDDRLPIRKTITDEATPPEVYAQRLATQLLRLAPGGYRLAMRVDGPSRANGLAWNILCVPGNNALLSLPLGTVGRGSISGAFAVPEAGCPAQTLELRGRPGESSETAQLTILDLSLEPLAAVR